MQYLLHILAAAKDQNSESRLRELLAENELSFALLLSSTTGQSAQDDDYDPLGPVDNQDSHLV